MSSNRKYLIVEPELCNGCRICELTCSFAHYQFYSPAHARIHVHKDERKGIAQPKVCRMCGKPLCIEACPQNAITQDELGVLHVNPETCDGCGKCVEACPFDAITLHPTTRFALICDTCNGAFSCVNACPEEALHAMTREEFKRYKQTRPSRKPDPIVKVF